MTAEIKSEIDEARRQTHETLRFIRNLEAQGVSDDHPGLTILWDNLLEQRNFYHSLLAQHPEYLHDILARVAGICRN